MSKSTKLSNYGIYFFLFLAFAISWLLYWPIVTATEQLDNPLMLLLYVLASFGPGLAAVIVVWFTKGKDAVKTLLRQLVKRDAKPRWLIASIVLPCFIILLTVIIISFNYGISFKAITFSRWLLTIPNLILNLFFFGVLSSAIAWQGYLLPAIQKKYSAVVSSLLIGILWALWQVPSFFIGDVFGLYQSITWMFIEVVALAIILTWLINSTDSLLFGVIFYTIYVTLAQTISPAIQLSGNLVHFQQITGIIIVNIALLLVIFCGRDLVFRKPLRKAID